ncbi:MAG: homoserine dehydrogenase [Clostridia bacterium]|nr:homoserine dehydrogenase [Clostridia bacterium]
MINVAILGFGVVGSGVMEIISERADELVGKTGEKLNVKYILDIRDFSAHPMAEKFTKSFDVILDDPEVSVVAEVIGGLDPAYTYTKKALEAGKNVVTSNKELVARKGAELLRIAKENGVSYLFEASVGGGIPIIRPLNQCLAANRITEMMGILNGTTNYILTSMIRKGNSFEEALAKAQELGYAERNPEADVEGIDACRKVSILASLVTGKTVDSEKIHTEGITKITLQDVKCAETLGFVIKLIGYIQVCGEQVFTRVSPLLIEKTSPLAGIEDVFNGVLVVGDSTGEVMFYGKGAGKRPTASAVVADIIDIAQNNPTGKFMWQDTEDKNFMVPLSESNSHFFLRVQNVKEELLEKVFGKIVAISNTDDNEIAFITCEMNEKEFEEKKDILGYGNVISCIRVHR